MLGLTSTVGAFEGVCEAYELTVQRLNSVEAVSVDRRWGVFPPKGLFLWSFSESQG